jgi:AcrR family transcriptional regulator
MTTTAARGERLPPGRHQTDAILRATLDLLREGGHGAVTTDSVASRAGVSKATIYRRWRSRSELIVAAAKQLMAPVEVPDLGDFRAEVTFLMSRRLEQYQSEGVGGVLSSVIGASIEDPQVRKLFSDWVLTQEATNGEMISRAIRRGELSADADRDNIVTLIGAPLFYRLVVEGRKPDRSLMDTVLQLLETFKAPSAPP